MKISGIKIALFAALTIFTGSIALADWDKGGHTGPNPEMFATSCSLLAGTYLGAWKDGQNLTESVQVMHDRIVMTRLAGGVGQGNTTTYFKTGPNSFRNSNGSVLFVRSNTTFSWANRGGGNKAGYRKLP